MIGLFLTNKHTMIHMIDHQMILPLGCDLPSRRI